MILLLITLYLISYISWFFRYKYSYERKECVIILNRGSDPEGTRGHVPHLWIMGDAPYKCWKCKRVDELIHNYTQYTNTQLTWVSRLRHGKTSRTTEIFSVLIKCILWANVFSIFSSITFWLKSLLAFSLARARIWSSIDRASSPDSISMAWK